MAPIETDAVRVYKGLVDSLLDRAVQVKPDGQIEPPLTETLVGKAIWEAPEGREQEAVQQLNQQTRLAAVEIAFREKFYRILASTSIDDPNFIHIWNLLDIVSIFSDNEQCEPGLIFWLIEELLDSQTIDGCRTVFDYLESRRERNIKKHFKQKSLVILRSCNELLRRLSRAEDTVFCGRVFIFLFQSFPLGDKSSVNLRGEFHNENVTTYDEIPNPANGNEDDDTTMTEGNEDSTTEGQGEGVSPAGNREIGASSQHLPKVVISGGKEKNSKEPVDLDALYPMFWSLQAYFSSPTKTFDSERFAKFKTGLEATLSAFKNINTDLENQKSQRSSEEARNSNKRKRVTDDTEVGTSFNPKYLTSRDLFDLEISDMAFRRHILVQALILLDFMLSLTPKAKSRSADLTNKSVLYGFVLSEEEAKWAANMRTAIEGYLRQGNGGNFYYRMVDTVLSRDKNWARWKAEGCPPIEKPAVTIPEYLSARDQATKAYADKRIRPSPMGSLDLKFLSDGEALANIERLKESDRISVPAADALMMSMLDDDMDIDMAQSQDDKDAALRSKHSKTWRILRLSAKTKLAAFDRIEDGKNLKALFESATAPTETPQPADVAEDSPELAKEISHGGDGAQDTPAPDASEVPDEGTSVLATEEAHEEDQKETIAPDESMGIEAEPVASSAASGDNPKEEPAS
ncbi:hypothetical protein N7509_003761 [Penicillium cosmopolitanum]|uniref:Nuclear matrix protein n=1 Tax=Penicillium cosmopolitanum TaxID=1131564 RepID=A0A9W9W5M7_9EURO|nr:uncharacterized protein N7509_003761 [Penicillium cosmopolitanum]KAJ5403890.1 hypothetical protein N7509_003761 [Penicillium cosmopolitanum]